MGHGGAKAQGKGGIPGKGFPGKGGPVGFKGASQKGHGKGYQGRCWTCGQVGHKSAECTHMHVNEVVRDVEPQQVASIGGVWTISQVSDLASRGGPVPTILTQKATMHNPARTHEKTKNVGQISFRSAAPTVSDRRAGGWHEVSGRRRPQAPIGRSASHIVPGRFAVLREEDEDYEEVDVCPVQQQLEAQRGGEGEEVCGVCTEITMDSAAAESVCPRWWAEQFGSSACAPQRSG